MKVFVLLSSVYSRRTKTFNLSFLVLGDEFSHKNVPVLQVMGNTVVQESMQQLTCLKPTMELGSSYSSIKHRTSWVYKVPFKSNHAYSMGNKMSSRDTLEKFIVLLEEKGKDFCMPREDRIIKKEYLKIN